MASKLQLVIWGSDGTCKIYWNVYDIYNMATILNTEKKKIKD
jgi:hypothetical protein